ncbi:hypothetical protein ES705_32283 [subsurface metagenome]
MPRFCPVFEKDDNRFIVPYDDCTGETPNDALMIGWGMMLVECIIWGARFAGDILDVGEELPHLKAELSGAKVFLIGGPMFDDAVNAKVC